MKFRIVIKMFCFGSGEDFFFYLFFFLLEDLCVFQDQTFAMCAQLCATLFGLADFAIVPRGWGSVGKYACS